MTSNQKPDDTGFDMSNLRYQLRSVLRPGETVAGYLQRLREARAHERIEHLTGEPRCCFCGKSASELLDSAFMHEFAEPGQSPADFVRQEDGTYNPATNHFACDACYVQNGAPSAPGRGWKAF